MDADLFRQLSAPTSGPRLATVTRLPNALRVAFTHTTGGLVARGGDLEDFFLRDEDGNWHPAHAKLVGDTVVVSSADVLQPTAVRYTGASLANGAGLPAAPFEAEAEGN